MSLLESLSIGSGALSAQSYGSKVTANNIANVNTAGYSRQTALLGQNPASVLGVRATGIQRNVDSILGGRLNDQAGALADANARQSYAGRIETALDPNGDGGLSTTLDKFFAAFQALQADPTDTGTRQTALASASNLASDVRGKATALREQRADVDSDVVETVRQANDLLKQVATLNASIGASATNDSSVATLTDQRDQALQKLSSLVGATSTIDSRGMANVSVGGFGVVIGDTARPLGANVDATTGLHHVTIDAPTSVILDQRLGKSTAAAQINVRDTEIQGRIDELDQFVTDFATSVNAVHSANYGVDGSTGNPLFTSGGAGNATTFDVDSAMTEQKLATATASTSSGSNGGVTAMLALQTSKVAGGGTETLNQALSTSITAAGIATQRATADVTTEQSKYDQISEAVQNASGVSLDEEDINLERYQRAYQAAAKVVNTIDEMLQTLINMKQ